jgi:hypothetical protein
LAVQWDGDRHILIRCQCLKDQFDFKMDHWRNVTITYAFNE